MNTNFKKMKPERQSLEIFKGSVVNGITNALINGLINLFQHHDEDTLFLTVDNISTGSQTVMGGAVILATTLAIILTSTSFLTLKTANKPAYFPHVFLLSLKNAFFVFGVLTAISVLWQRFIGSFLVTPIESAIIVAIVAGLVAGTIDYMTKTNIKAKNTLN